VCAPNESWMKIDKFWMQIEVLWMKAGDGRTKVAWKIKIE